MEAPFTFRPIGHVRSGKDLRFKARHQPDEKDAESSVLELEPWPGMRESVRDLEGMERIWIVWVFHRAESWRPLVLPPRGPAQRRGVLSTRSPHRPNPIGITPVRLLHVEKLRLHLGPCDLLEGTPVLDIKPYVPSYDSFPEASAGWIDAVDALSREAPSYRVGFAPLAREQLDWLRGRWSVDFEPRLVELLSRDPSPHRTRRIRTRRDGPFEIGCGTWKALFAVNGTEVTVGSIEPSYPVRFLTEAWRTGIPDHDAMLDFLTRWPCPALEPRDP